MRPRREVAFDQLAHEIEVRLRGRGKAHLCFFLVFTSMLNAPLMRSVHGLDQGLIAMAGIHLAPLRRDSDDPVGPVTDG